MPRRRRSFGDEHESARFAIQTIDDRNLSAVGDFKREQLAQFFPQGRPAIGLGWMREQKWRLVHDDVIVALVDNLEIARGLHVDLASDRPT